MSNRMFVCDTLPHDEFLWFPFNPFLCPGDGRSGSPVSEDRAVAAHTHRAAAAGILQLHVRKAFKSPGVLFSSCGTHCLHFSFFLTLPGWSCGESVEKPFTASHWSPSDCSPASSYSRGVTRCEFVSPHVRIHVLMWLQLAALSVLLHCGTLVLITDWSQWLILEV